jgi:hypothetical protein
LKNEADGACGLAHHGKDQFPKQQPFFVFCAIWSRISREDMLVVDLRSRLQNIATPAIWKEAACLAGHSPAQ